MSSPEHDLPNSSVGLPKIADPTRIAGPTIDQRSREMAARLNERLSGLSGNPHPLQWNMTPELAYGRHRGPARLKSRHAAVAVGMFWDPDCGWVFPLTRRPHTLRNHAGQICFPGGRIESDETPPQAALREFEEELGQPAEVIRICGQLPVQYVYASDHHVTPIVCILRKPDRPWKPDPGEVDEVIEFPLKGVLAQTNLESPTSVSTIWHHRSVRSADSAATEVAQIRFRAPAFAYRSQRIWGATAVILDQLAQCLLPR